MELRDYLEVARRRWAVILVALTATLLVAAAVASLSTPQYSSTTRLFVTSKKDGDAEYATSLLSEQRVTTYANLAEGEELARRVIARLDLDMEPAELTEKLETDVVPDTVLLGITVVDSDARRAQRLATAVAAELINLVSELEATPRRRSLSTVRVGVVDPASLRDTPISPNPQRIFLIAAVFGILLGLGGAVIRELLDSTVRSETDVAAATGATTLGTIPPGRRRTRRLLITDRGTPIDRVDAFRSLRTNLRFSKVEHPGMVIVVTGPVAEEGKTTIAANLALTFAKARYRVLLIDGDLRQPRIRAELRLGTGRGLTTVLAGRTDLEDAILEYDAVHLSVLTSGDMPSESSEMLESPEMAKLIEQARADFDIVIIDAPPLLQVPDATTLAAHSDGALLVARHGKTTKAQLRRAVAGLEGVHVRTLGVVLDMT